MTMRFVLILTAFTLLLLAGCGDSPTEPTGSFSISVGMDPTPVNSIVTYTVANNTRQTIYLDPCPGVFAEKRQPDNSWVGVWSEQAIDDCSAIYVEPYGLAPGDSFTPRCGGMRCGPTFSEAGTYRLGLQVTANLSDWTRPPVYSNTFEVQ